MQAEARFPLLLHGFTGSSASWGDLLLDGLAASVGAPVLVDLPGHGGQQIPPAGIELESTLANIEAHGDWPADLIGYSMGGRLALHFAVSHPDAVQRLVLESASPGLESGAEQAARRAADEILADRIEMGLEAFVDDWMSQPLFETQRAVPVPELARQRAIRLANDPSALAASLRALGTGSLPSLWDRLPRLGVPTLLLVGELDRKFVDINRRMVERLPHAELVIVPDAGHAVHLERPDVWLDAVRSFLT